MSDGSSSTPEQESNQPTEVFLTNIHDDPYDPMYTHLHALRSVGFPIRFSKTASNPQGESVSNHLSVWIDSKETDDKLDTIFIEEMGYDIYDILSEVSGLKFMLEADENEARVKKGEPTEEVSGLTLGYLAEGDIDRYIEVNEFDFLPEERKLLATSGEHLPRFRVTFQRCFVSAYENLQAKIKSGDLSLAQFLKPEHTELYERLRGQGVDPMDPEALIGLERSMIQDILNKDPSLKP